MRSQTSDKVVEGVLEWIHTEMDDLLPTRTIASRSVAHIERRYRTDFDADSTITRRNAEGHWVEACIYETLLQSLVADPVVDILVPKGFDVEARKRKLLDQQNGFSYHPRAHDIVVQGQGQDIAEFDFLLILGRVVVFGEVKTSKANLSNFHRDYRLRLNILQRLFDLDRFVHVIVSTEDIGGNTEVMKVLAEPDTDLVLVGSMEDWRAVLHSVNHTMKYEQRRFPFLVSAYDLPCRDFLWPKWHKELQEQILWNAKRGATRPLRHWISERNYPVDKVILGGLYRQGLETILNNYTLEFRGDAIGETTEAFQIFNKTILAIKMGDDFRPCLYLQIKGRKEWRKLGLDKGVFRCERKIPGNIGFAIRLNRIQPSIGANLTRKILSTFDRPEAHRKKKGRPDCKLDRIKEQVRIPRKRRNSAKEES